MTLTKRKLRSFFVRSNPSVVKLVKGEAFVYGDLDGFAASFNLNDKSTTSVNYFKVPMLGNFCGSSLAAWQK